MHDRLAGDEAAGRSGEVGLICGLRDALRPAGPPGSSPRREAPHVDRPLPGQEVGIEQTAERARAV
jgi:hypothetical protein